ncbi:MAG: hypothetical protein QOE25_908, partial [Actinomycetota bacterium]|nr:hypothetical protein [Actinomycetota bacterium]
MRPAGIPVADPDRRGGPARSKPESERNFRPDVQGLRAIAVAMVVAYHLY